MRECVDVPLMIPVVFTPVPLISGVRLAVVVLRLFWSWIGTAPSEGFWLGESILDGRDDWGARKRRNFRHASIYVEES